MVSLVVLGSGDSLVLVLVVLVAVVAVVAVVLSVVLWGEEEKARKG